MPVFWSLRPERRRKSRCYSVSLPDWNACMSEKLLELSSVVNVLSRTVGDMEKQRQSNETKSQVLTALLVSVIQAMSADQRAEARRNFQSATAALINASTRSGRDALKKEIADAQKLLE